METPTTCRGVLHLTVIALDFNMRLHAIIAQI